MFSPYYGWALRGGRPAAADNHCALNVALYGAGSRRWTMTERGARHVQREPRCFTLGPSSLTWERDGLTIRIDERNVPWPSRVRGTVRVFPKALCRFNAPLDDAGRHRWGPIAPCARVEATFESPGLRWSGDAYLDSNEGDEPIAGSAADAGPFTVWDWSRGSLRDGSTGVIYDVRQRQGADRVLALRFAPDGSAEPFDAPPRQPLPRTAWRIARAMRSDAGVPVQVEQTLEDTPFYARSVLRSGLLGEPVQSVHETLNVPRLRSAAVQFMLPWRMPRRA